MSHQDDVEQDDGSHPPCGDDAGAPAPQSLCVPRRRTHTVVAEGTSWDDLRDWPRYATVKMIEEDGKKRGCPNLLLPNAQGVWNLVPLTPAKLATYIANTRQPYQKRSGRRWVSGTDTKPGKDSPYTWGPFVTCRVPVPTIESGNVLRWYPPTHERVQWWTFRIYNITVETPGHEVYWPNRAWLAYLQRSVMRIPIQHLRATRLRGIYLSFTVGSPLLPGTLPKAGVVSTGGSNNLLRAPLITRFGDEAGVLSTVDVTYAALNRPWGKPLTADPVGRMRVRAANGPVTIPGIPSPDASESALANAFANRLPDPGTSTRADAMERWYRDPLSIQDTILHEFGHLLDKTRPPRIDYTAEYGGTDEQWEEERAQRGRTFNRLRTGTQGHKGPTWETFHNYIDEINYGGSTLDATEGFAECYKRHFSGQTLAAAGQGDPGTHGQAALRLFMNNGYPTLESVRRSVIAQAHYMASEPNLVIDNPAPDPWNPHTDHERQRIAAEREQAAAEG